MLRTKSSGVVDRVIVSWASGRLGAAGQRASQFPQARHVDRRA
jgi:hypothetical protein